VSSRSDYGDDGTDDVLVTWDYDAAGHVIETALDVDLSTPEPDLTLTATWNGDDIATQQSEIFGQLSLQTYLYDCP